MGSPDFLEQIRAPIEASRAEADRIMAAAALRAQAAQSDEQISLEAQRRLDRLTELCREIDHHSQHLETAYTDMVDSLAARMMRLSEIARTDDFSPPEWPVGAEHNVEIKLSETREVTLRLSRNRERRNGARKRSPERRDNR